MKTEVLIWQGKAKIVLHAENEFEKDLIEKVKNSRIGYKTEAEVLTKCSYHTHSEHRIEISLIENES